MKRVELKGIKFTLRKPKEDDAEELRKFINSLIKENLRLARKKPVTLEEEKRWLRGLLKGMKKGRIIFILAETDGKIAGTCEISKSHSFPSTHDHLGNLGIAVAKPFRRKGLGKTLMKEALEQAERKGFKIIKLTVAEDNEPAKRLYRKLGFKPVGRIPKGFKVGNKYIDELIMVKEL